MIITCPNCNKKFKIDNSLIPDEGRDLQCGSCNHIWFYNIQEKNNEVLELKQEIISDEIEPKVENKDDKIDFNSVNNTISLHRKKITNTLYTINALNELIKTINNGVLDTNYQVEWDTYKNMILISNKEGLQKIPTRILKIIEL